MAVEPACRIKQLGRQSGLVREAGGDGDDGVAAGFAAESGDDGFDALLGGLLGREAGPFVKAAAGSMAPFGR
jgi:hypothetical protein